MRLIDAEAFDARVRVAGGMSEEELTDDFKDGVLAVLELLKTQSTVEPSPEGEWLDRSVRDDPKAEVIEQWQSAKCSVCGKYHTTPYLYYFDWYDWCPNCGARMRKRGEET